MTINGATNHTELNKPDPNEPAGKATEPARVAVVLPGDLAPTVPPGNSAERYDRSANQIDLRKILKESYVIAVDSGYSNVERLGAQADLLIGDMDSIQTAELEQAEQNGTEIRRFNRNKDHTDLELAIEAAKKYHTTKPGQRARHVEEIVVVGMWGSRRDHELATLMHLSSPKHNTYRIWASDGVRHMWVVHDRLELSLPEGSQLSLQPIFGPCQNVETSGLAWPLHSERLEADESRAVSNICIGPQQHISIGSGVLLAICEPQG